MQEVDPTDAIALVIDVLVCSRVHVRQSTSHPGIEQLGIVVCLEECHCTEYVPVDLKLNETLQFGWELTREGLRYFIIPYCAELDCGLDFPEEVMWDTMLPLNL